MLGASKLENFTDVKQFNRLLLMSVERNINQRDWKSANGDRARRLLEEHGCQILSIAEAIKRSMCLTIKLSFNVRKIAPSDMFRLKVA